MSSRERRIVHLALARSRRPAHRESGRRRPPLPGGLSQGLQARRKTARGRFHRLVFSATYGSFSATLCVEAFDLTPATICPVNLDDTIVAIATPPGRGGIGVVRLAGPEARQIALPMLRLKHDLDPGRAIFGELIEPPTAVRRERSQTASTKSSSPTSPSRTPTPPTTSSKSPPTARPSFCATLSSSPSPAAPASPSPASSPCAPFSTDASISPRPKPSATSSTRKLSTRPKSRPSNSKARSPAACSPSSKSW